MTIEKMKKAVFHFNTALKAHFIENDYIFAKNNYEKAIKINPYYAKSHHNLAILLFENFNNLEKKSKFHFLKAIEIFKKQKKDTKFSCSVFRKKFEKLENNIFISDFKINKVRHLENVEIPMDKNKLKHLIFTGNNGSGKTSVLEECKNYLQKILELPLEKLFSEEGKKFFLNQENEVMRLTFNEKLLTFRLNYEMGNFILKYFPTHKEKFSLEPIKRIERVVFPLITPLETNKKLNKKLIYYLVDLDYIHARSFRRQRSIDDKTVEKEIRKWFENFEKVIKKVDERIIDIDLRSDEYGYTFEFTPKEPNEKFTFAELSGGYAAVFDIVTELILECSAKSLSYEDLQGIVLIDEPEVHLHIKMQKRLMPLLTEIFPKVQFIIATHSAFILNSSENSVVYDLQNRQRLTDASDIPLFIKLVKLEKEDKITEEEEEKLNALDIELDIVIPYVDDKTFKLFKKNQKYLYEL
ncbi:MAG: hypothetical protein B6I24_10730 [Bacteroidetes bacterium 4572_128]|nr:MAG: hypothetical protein B6I24_10730 [Bacteroidetes bacterium 4572_128]